jgi:hypothetical protein
VPPVALVPPDVALPPEEVEPPVATLPPVAVAPPVLAAPPVALLAPVVLCAPPVATATAPPVVTAAPPVPGAPPEGTDARPPVDAPPVVVSAPPRPEETTTVGCVAFTRAGELSCGETKLCKCRVAVANCTAVRKVSPIPPVVLSFVAGCDVRGSRSDDGIAGNRPQ